MIEIGARVAMSFIVDEAKFKKDPNGTLRDALMNNRAYISDGDNYAPEPWNEGVIDEDVDFHLGQHKVRVIK